MKKTFFVILALVLALAMLCACSPTKIIEKAIEKETGHDVKIDKDGDTITMHGKDGDSVMIASGDDLKWPADKMGPLPEMKGNITSVIAGEKECNVMLDAVTRADADAYIQKLKDMNLSDVYGNELETIVTFGGAGDDYSVTFVFSGDDKSGTVNLTYGFNN